MPPNATNPSGEDRPVPVANNAAMKLLDVRLKPASAILQSIIGSFTGPKRQEVVMLKAGGTVELHQLVKATDEGGGTEMHLMSRTETHSVLRSAASIRYPGESRDCLAVTSDAGTLAIWEFAETTGICKILHAETLGKTGCRRDTVGQYCASDPAGRAVLVAAVEKRKLVLVVNKDATGQSVLASPLAAHRPRTITTAVIGVDNGHGNPLFAVLEWQYPDLELNPEAASQAPKKQIAYYELDLGLNHVSRRWATSVPGTSCCLAALPARGVLVGSENEIRYVHDETSTIIECPIPRRELHPEGKGILVTHISVHRQKKGQFFCLAQSELGDVYKVTLDLEEKSMSIAFLDTLPTAMSLNISDLGYLFCAAEFGDHHLYHFLRIDLPDAPTCTSKDASAVTKFAPSCLLQNLRKVHTLPNPSPTTSVLVGELAGNETSPQIYTLTGRGPHAAICTSRHGAAVTELAVSELPGIPAGIFTVAGPGGLDRYIIVSFADATLVLSILPGGGIEEEQEQSGFETDAPTLACSALGSDGSVCQVHPSGVRHIEMGGKSKQWHTPGLKRIERASTNESQVLIAFAGGEVIYFELSSVSGVLETKKEQGVGADVCCLDVGTIASGRSRSMFAAIGCRDQTVRIVSLEPGSLLSQRGSTVLKSRPHSVSLQALSKEGNGDLTLVIGLDDGSCLRTTVDPITGSIGSSPTRRFLGARPVSVSRISIDSQPGALMLSSRPWISRRDDASGKHLMAPLSFAPLDHGCSFRSEAVPEAIIATAGKTLRILSVEVSSASSADEESFNTHRVPLRYTPRQMTLLGVAEKKVVLVVVESDYNEYGIEEKKAMGFDPEKGSTSGAGGKADDDDAMDMDEDSDNEGEKKDETKEDDEDPEEKEAKRTVVRGPVPPAPGQWGSCIRLLDPSNNCASLDCVEMGRNEAALCCTSVRFRSKGGEALLAVGTVTGMTLHPLKQASSHIVLYRIVNGDRFQLLHRTEVTDGPVLAMAHFQGRLVVGVGKCLRLFEMGKKQLMRKYDLKGLPSMVKTIKTVGDRAYVGDLLQSIQVVRYDSTQNRLVLIAVDANPRPIVASELLDLHTVAVSDKFGTISILRVPKGAESTGSITDNTGSRALWEKDASIPQLVQLCQYYVGEIVTSMTRAPLVAGGPECLIYVTVSGRIAALVPFVGREAVEFYESLQSELRTVAPRPVGRDPWSYRSYYAPCMHVIDGDLCGAFGLLSHSEQSAIAEKLELSIAEITKKLEDSRNALL